MVENNHSLLKTIRRIDAIFCFLNQKMASFSGIILIIVTTMIALGVVNRSFFHFQWLFVEEWSSLALIPMSYLAFSYTLRKNRHLNMNMIVSLLPLKFRTILAIFSAVIAIVCLGFMVNSSFDWFIYTVENNVLSSGPMQTPIWIFTPIIVIGLVLFMVDMILYLVNQILILIYKNSVLEFSYEEEGLLMSRKESKGE